MARTCTKFLIVTAVLVLSLTLVALIAIPEIMIKPMIDLHVDYARIYQPDDHELEGGGLMPSESLLLRSEDGVSLQAHHVAHHEPRGVVIFLSGIHNPSVTAFYGHAKMVYDAGFSSILLDVRAHGGSDGGLVGLGYTEPADVKAVIDFISASPHYKGLPIVLFGLSMGGSIALNSAALFEEVGGVISLSAYSSFQDAFSDNMAGMGFPGFLSRVQKVFIGRYLARQYGRDVMYRTPGNLISRITAPLLMMHSLDDSQVPFRSFERLMASAPPHVETYVVPGDLHFILPDAGILRPYEHAGYKGVILGFLDAHFPSADSSATDTSGTGTARTSTPVRRSA